MSRLKIIARHDILNRDFAIVMIGDKFYEDITHAACLAQFLKENGIETNELQFRPEIDSFKEIAQENNVKVCLAHSSSKENGIFFIYEINENGDILELDNIDNDVKEKIENHYNLELKDENKHDGDYYRNNPYKENKEELELKYLERMLDLKDRSEFFQTLKNDFDYTLGFFAKDGYTVSFESFNGDNSYISVWAFGNSVFENDISKLDRLLEDSDNEYLEAVNKYDCTWSYDGYSAPNEIICEFTTKNNVKIKLSAFSSWVSIKEAVDSNGEDVMYQLDNYIEDIEDITPDEILELDDFKPEDFSEE